MSHSIMERIHSGTSRFMPTMICLQQSQDENRPGVIPTDAGGYIPTHDEIDELIGAIYSWYDHISNREIEGHNEALNMRYFAGMRGPNRKPGFVYLVQCAEAFKIGLSIHPHKRVKAIRRNGEEATLIHVISTDNMRAAESMLHARYRKKALGNEWFALSPADVKEISGLNEITFLEGS